MPGVYILQLKWGKHIHKDLKIVRLDLAHVEEYDLLRQVLQEYSHRKPNSLNQTLVPNSAHC